MLYLSLLLGVLNVQAKVAIPKVALDYSHGEFVPILIQMKPPTDVLKKIESSKFRNSDLKAEELVSQLQEYASETQKPVLDYLKKLQADGSVSGYRGYFISNTIAVEASKEVLQDISNFQGVAAMGANFIKQDLGLKRRDYNEKLYYPEYNTNDDPDLTKSPQYYGPAIRQTNAHKVDDAVIEKAKRLTFGSIDTGAEFTHPSLKENYKGIEDHDYSWFEGDPKVNSSLPSDSLDNGTGVLSLAVGKFPVGISPRSKWFACRFSQNGDSPTENYIRCLQFMLAPTDLQGNHPNPKMRPHVIGNAWGCMETENCFNEPFVYATKAIYLAGIFSLAGAGVEKELKCASITHPPAINSHSFVVGSTYEKDEYPYWYGSIGPSRFKRNAIDVTAPGEGVLVASESKTYKFSNGNSFSVPIAAGGFLLVMAACPQLERDPDKLAQVLRESASPLYSTLGCGGNNNTSIPNNEFGYGMVNIEVAIKLCKAFAY